MNKTLIFIVFAFLFYSSSSYSQINVELSKPQLELQSNNINIYYDILNSVSADTFKIWLAITDSSGSAISTKFISGDIGNVVSGGSKKTIVWNFVADSIFLENGIYVQVFAEKLNIIVPPVITETKTQSLSVDTKESVAQTEINNPEEMTDSFKSFSRGGLILQSLVFPGWGLTKIKNKPHWLKGVAGYGCIAASVFYNKQAVTSYNDYLTTLDTQELDTYFNNSVNEDNLSEYYAYAAIGIWLGDFIWTLAGSSDLKKDSRYSQLERFSLNTKYSPHAKTPMLTLSYNF